MDAANAHIEAAPGDHGPGNFSVALRSGTATATHAGLSCGPVAGFLDLLLDMQASGDWPGLVVEYDGSSVGSDFGAVVASQALEWSDPTLWFENPVMTGDERAHGGKTWVSLIDYNVWEPPVGWREVVAVGYPEWVQPTGAHDAYSIGDRVAFNGADYESKINGNVWSPTAYPAGWMAL